MKRVKMMLLSLLVLGVVGGAMAFKAKFTASYCTTPVRIDGGAHVCTASPGVVLKCPNLFANITHDDATQFNAWCTTIPQGGACNANLNCANQPPRSLDNDN